MGDIQSAEYGGMVFYAIDNEAESLESSGLLTITSGGDIADAGTAAMVEAPGFHEGLQTKLLFESDAMSLFYAWFKSDFPLPLHTHDCDCLYHVLAGSVRVGTKDLGPGEGFFVPAGVPYRHRAGPDGLELLEFRATNRFDIKMLAKTAKSWSDICSKLGDNKARWLQEKRPSVEG